MTQVLHNISKLAFIETQLLQNFTIVHGTGVILNNRQHFEPLPLVGLAQCEVVSKVENKTKLFTTTLNALLYEHFDVRARHIAFLATCVDGERYLIGINEAPYPVINTSDALPGKSTEPSGCSLTVELTDTHGLLPVLD